MPSSRDTGSQPSERFEALEHQLTEQIGPRLKRARLERGLSQSELGEVLGYAPTMISAFENNRRRMKVQDLVAVCIALDKEPGFFLPFADHGRPDSADTRRVAATLRAEVAQLPTNDLTSYLLGLIDEVEGEARADGRVPALAHLQPEAAARQVLDLCGITQPSVDMDEICSHLGVGLLRRPAPNALSAAVLAIDDGDFVIVVNKRHGKGRRRFSVAHELGHAVLGHAATFHLDLDQDDVVGEPPNYNYLDERQANQFAAALLMDERWVRADFARGMRTPYELAQRYDVSETAMSYRLVNLRLL